MHIIQPSKMFHISGNQHEQLKHLALKYLGPTNNSLLGSMPVLPFGSPEIQISICWLILTHIFRSDFSNVVNKHLR